MIVYQVMQEFWYQPSIRSSMSKCISIRVSMDTNLIIGSSASICETNVLNVSTFLV